MSSICLYLSQATADAPVISQLVVRFLQLLAPWTVLTIVGWGIWQTLRDTFKYTSELHSIPCSKCQYYTNNHRLKCTLHPKMAMSEAAIDCPDFCEES